MAAIGFVGLGHMGLPMAINLVKAGHRVTGFDLQPAARETFLKAGGHVAKHLGDVGAGQACLITMLQTGEQVKSVCLGGQGLFTQVSANTLWIDCSSIDVESTRTLHQQAEAHQLLPLDAPVSGGVAGAHAGILTFMIGGAEDVFERAKPILQHMGKTLIHTGPAGSGQAAKICNNMILGISMIAVSEAFVLAEQLGLSHQKLFDVVTHSSGQCWAMSHYPPVPGLVEGVPANHDYQAGFTAAMMLKDLDLSQHAARLSQVTPALSGYATALYRQLNEQGDGGLDFSAIIRLIEETPSTGS